MANERYRPITQLGLGGTGLGDMYPATSDTAAHATVDAAWDAGVRKLQNRKENDAIFNAEHATVAFPPRGPLNVS